MEPVSDLVPSLRPRRGVGGSAPAPLAPLGLSRAAACLCFAGTIFLSFFLAGCQRAAPPPPPPAVQPPVNLAETRSRAEQGDAAAQKLLGDLYASGQGVRRDYKEAAEWFRKAAEQGHAAAQNSLGELCEAGQGVKTSEAEAAAWYRKAAEQGLAGAQYNLAVLHAFGRGVPLNEAEAVQWYRRAAEQGHALAQFNIGQRYQLGRGVPVDLAEAYKWLTLAAPSITDAGQLLDELKGTMSRGQIAEGRRRAEQAAAQVPAGR